MSKQIGIIDQIGEAAALEQLAEESAELSKSALKMARIIRNENPTPIDYCAAYRSLLEELGDVRLCVSALEEKYGTLNTTDIERRKLERWKTRLSKKLHERRSDNDNAEI